MTGFGGNYEYNDTSVITVTKGDFEHLDPFYRSLFNYRSWLRIAVHLSLTCKMKVLIICCFHHCLLPEILYWFDMTTAEHTSLRSAQKEWAKSCCKDQHRWWKSKYSVSTIDKCHSLVSPSSLCVCGKLSSSFSLNFCSLKCKHCIFISQWCWEDVLARATLQIPEEAETLNVTTRVGTGCAVVRTSREHPHLPRNRVSLKRGGFVPCKRELQQH